MNATIVAVKRGYWLGVHTYPNSAVSKALFIGFLAKNINYYTFTFLDHFYLYR